MKTKSKISIFLENWNVLNCKKFNLKTVFGFWSKRILSFHENLNEHSDELFVRDKQIFLNRVYTLLNRGVTVGANKYFLMPKI